MEDVILFYNLYIEHDGDFTKFEKYKLNKQTALLYEGMIQQFTIEQKEWFNKYFHIDFS